MDDITRRMFENERRRHQRALERLADSLLNSATLISEYVKENATAPAPMLPTFELRGLAHDVMRATEAISALDALNEVAYAFELKVEDER